MVHVCIEMETLFQRHFIAEEICITLKISIIQLGNEAHFSFIKGYGYHWGGAIRIFYFRVPYKTVSKTVSLSLVISPIPKVM